MHWKGNIFLAILFMGIFFMFSSFYGSPLKAAEAELTISGAASLTNAFDELIGIYKKGHPGVTVNANYAASNPLLRQILEGAPVDVFASADQATMNKAQEAGVIEPATRKNFAQNTLVLIVPAGSPKPADLQNLEKFRRIAVGNPDSVPAGRYTREALTKAGLWDKLAPSFIFGESVRQVLDYVARGEVDAGFVYGTDARQQSGKVDVALVVGNHEPVNYPIAIMKTGKDPRAGQEFINLVLSPEGQKVLEKFGFAPAAK